MVGQPITIDMRRWQGERTSAYDRDPADPKRPLEIGDEVTAHLDDGTSVTLVLTRRRVAPYRVVTMRASRAVSGWTRHFGTEREARGFAADALRAHFTAGDVVTDITRAGGQRFRRVTTPRTAL